jgi:hypothetical protein
MVWKHKVTLCTTSLEVELYPTSAMLPATLLGQFQRWTHGAILPLQATLHTINYNTNRVHEVFSVQVLQLLLRVYSLDMSVH